MDLADPNPFSGLTGDPRLQVRSYNVIGALCLPHPSDCKLTREHETLALSLQKDLQILQDRDLGDLHRPIKSFGVAYEQFKAKELSSWRLAGLEPAPRETLVRASGSLNAPLAHHLLQPSFTTLSPQDGSETADPSNGCIAMVMGNLYTPSTLIFDHLHRRSEKSEGLENLPEPVLSCHESHTRSICESMLAKVELLYGRKVQNRILESKNNGYKFTALPLWGPFEGVTLFLAHESNYSNADLRYTFRRICLFVAHPQRLFYEPANSKSTILRDKIHIAAAKMTGMPVREFYFRQKEWIKLVLNPFRAMVIKEQGAILNDLQYSKPDTDVIQTTNEAHKAESVDHRKNEASQKPVRSTGSSKYPTSVLRNASDLAAFDETRRSAMQRYGNKRTRVPRKNPRQARNKTARAQAVLQLQNRISVTVALSSSTPNLTTVLEDAGQELLSTENDVISSSLTTTDKTPKESREEHCGEMMNSLSSGDKYLSRSDERCISQRMRSGDLVQSRIKEIRQRTSRR